MLAAFEFEDNQGVTIVDRYRLLTTIAIPTSIAIPASIKTDGHTFSEYGHIRSRLPIQKRASSNIEFSYDDVFFCHRIRIHIHQTACFRSVPLVHVEQEVL